MDGKSLLPILQQKRQTNQNTSAVAGAGGANAGANGAGANGANGAGANGANGAGANGANGAGANGANGAGANGANGANGTGWRTEFMFEYYPITNWVNWTKHHITRVDDSPNNTFRGG
jgi:hypothetical protein